MLCTHLCSVTQDLLRSWFVSFQIIDQDSENEVQDGTVAKGDQLEQDIDEETDEDSFDHVLKALRHGYDIYIYICKHSFKVRDDAFGYEMRVN